MNESQKRFFAIKLLILIHYSPNVTKLPPSMYYLHTGNPYCSQVRFRGPSFFRCLSSEETQLAGKVTVDKVRQAVS